jgi:hypothetical protein
MPKYLLLFKYSPEGAKGLLKEKAAPRETEIRKTFEGMGEKSKNCTGRLAASTPARSLWNCPTPRLERRFRWLPRPPERFLKSPRWRCSPQANSTGLSRRR